MVRVLVLRNIKAWVQVKFLTPWSIDSKRVAVPVDFECYVVPGVLIPHSVVVQDA